MSATDADAGDTVTLSLAGVLDDADNAVTGKFALDATSGAITYTGAGENFESFDYPANAFTLTLRAADDFDTVQATVTVEVTDVDGEAPGRPAAPTFGVSTATSLTVNWVAPANPGPPITDYDVQYAVAGSDSFTDAGYDGDGASHDGTRVSHDFTGVSHVFTGLEPDTEYEVQVRATNVDGTGPWSASGTARTGDDNAPPAFVAGEPPAAVEGPVRLGVAENVAALGTATAADPDDTVTGYTLGGTNGALFQLQDVGGGVALAFRTPPDFEIPRGGAAGDSNVYEFTLTATSGAGDRERSVTLAWVVTVTGVDEPPAFAGDAAFTRRRERRRLAGTVSGGRSGRRRHGELHAGRRRRGPVLDRGRRRAHLRRRARFRDPARRRRTTTPISTRCRSPPPAARPRKAVTRAYTVTVTDVPAPGAPDAPTFGDRHGHQPGRHLDRAGQRRAADHRLRRRVPPRQHRARRFVHRREPRRHGHDAHDRQSARRTPPTRCGCGRAAPRGAGSGRSRARRRPGRTARPCSTRAPPPRCPWWRTRSTC